MQPQPSYQPLWSMMKALPGSGEAGARWFRSPSITRYGRLLTILSGLSPGGSLWSPTARSRPSCLEPDWHPLGNL